MSIFLSSGEASGDHYTANVALALRAAGYDGELWGMGGVESRGAGVRLEWAGDKLQLLGLTEVLTAIPSLFAMGKDIVRRVLKERPECVIVADSPDFHMRLIKMLRDGGYGGRIYYISPPSVWAWRSGRTESLRQYVDECLPLFEFEHDYLVSRGCRSFWVGYPMLEEFSQQVIRQSMPDFLASDDRLVAMLPGSRRSETSKLLPVLERSAEALECRGWHPVFSVAPGLNPAVRESILERFKKNGTDYYEGPGRHLLSAAKCAIGASGTVTVESMLLGCYMIVTYKLNPFSAMIGRRVIRTKNYAMANILAGCDMFPELMQENATVENILKCSLAWLDGTDEDRAARTAVMERTRAKLGEPGCYKKWAERILEATVRC